MKLFTHLKILLSSISYELLIGYLLNLTIIFQKIIIKLSQIHKAVKVLNLNKIKTRSL